MILARQNIAPNPSSGYFISPHSGPRPLSNSVAVYNLKLSSLCGTSPYPTPESGSFIFAQYTDGIYPRVNLIFMEASGLIIFCSLHRADPCFCVYISTCGCLLVVPRPHCVESLCIFDPTLYICHLFMRREAFC